MQGRSPGGVQSFYSYGYRASVIELQSIVSRFISRVARVEDRQGRKLSKKERGERQENQCGRHAREAMKLVAECLTPFLSR